MQLGLQAEEQSALLLRHVRHWDPRPGGGGGVPVRRVGLPLSLTTEEGIEERGLGHCRSPSDYNRHITRERGRPRRDDGGHILGRHDGADLPAGDRRVPETPPAVENI